MDNGLLSQHYRVIVELIARDKQIPEALPEGVMLSAERGIPGVICFKLITPIDMEQLRKEIELYKEVLRAV